MRPMGSWMTSVRPMSLRQPRRADSNDAERPTISPRTLAVQLISGHRLGGVSREPLGGYVFDDPGPAGARRAEHHRDEGLGDEPAPVNDHGWQVTRLVHALERPRGELETLGGIGDRQQRVAARSLVLRCYGLRLRVQRRS